MSTQPEREVDAGLDRLVYFSDAVFAIAITLLALDIRLPAGARDAPAGDVLARLAAATPHIQSYALSFIVIGLFWLGHHRMFRFVRGYDSVLILLNLLFLMLIAFIPFPTTLIGGYTSWVVLAFYALTLTVAGLLSDAVRLYISAHPVLLAAGVDPRAFRGTWVPYVAQPGLFVLSALIALWAPVLTWLIWWGVLALSIRDALLNQRYSDLGR